MIALSRDCTITAWRTVCVNTIIGVNFGVPRTSEENAQLSRFGANIRRERVAKGYTQEKLAEAIGINIRNLQRLEAGETNVLVTTLVRLRNALGCSADKLVPR